MPLCRNFPGRFLSRLPADDDCVTLRSSRQRGIAYADHAPTGSSRRCRSSAKETDRLENTLVKAGIDQITYTTKKKNINRSHGYERRLGEEKPILKALFGVGRKQRMWTNCCPKPPLATAMNYLLSNRDGLTCTSKTDAVTFPTTPRKTASGL